MKEDKEIQKLFNEIPLSTHLTVSIQLAMIDLLSAVGFRENKMWTDDEEDVLSIIFDSAEKTAKQIEEDLMEDYGCSKTPIKKIHLEGFKQAETQVLNTPVVSKRFIELTRDDLVRFKSDLPIDEVSIFDFKSSAMSRDEMRKAEVIIFKDGEQIKELKNRY